METTEKTETNRPITPLKSAVTEEDKRVAASVLGSVRTEKKRAATQENMRLLRERGLAWVKPLTPLSEIRCTCDAGESLEGHRWDCPRGQAIKRRRKEGRL
jgi:hypothetical protein